MKYVKYFKWLLLGITLIIIAVFFRNSQDMGNIGMYLSWAYILLVIAIVLSIGLPFMYIAQKPKMLKKTLMSLSALLAVLAISYLLASDTPIKLFNGEFSSTTDSKLAGISLNAMYILVGIAVLSLLAGGVRNMIRNR